MRSLHLRNLPLRSLLCAAALAALTLAPPAAARCIDEDTPDSPVPGSAAALAADASAPRLGLQGMVQEAVRRSNAVGAARLLAEAAASDVEETRAAAKLQASRSGTLGLASSSGRNVTTQTGAQAAFSVNLGARPTELLTRMLSDRRTVVK